jgi:hypothetical protein
MRASSGKGSMTEKGIELEQRSVTRSWCSLHLTYGTCQGRLLGQSKAPVSSAQK